MIRGVVFLSAFILLFSYYVYSPMPYGIAEPTKLMFVDAAFRTVRHLAKAGDALGIQSESDTLRMLDTALYLQDVPKNMRAYYHNFDSVRVRVYEPAKRKEEYIPALVYFHGGGFIANSIEMYDEAMLNIARKLKMVVVSVDYRQSPQYKFPIPFKDCCRATRYMMRNAELFHVNPLKIAVAGDSTGGNLAAAVAMKLSQDMSLQSLAFQAMLNPTLQAIDFTLPSYIQHENVATGFVNGRDNVALFYSMYALGNDSATESLLDGRAYNKIRRSEKVHMLDHINHSEVPTLFTKDWHESSEMRNDGDISDKLYKLVTNPFFAPLMAEDHQLLNAVPPAFILTAGFDMLRDDGILFVKRLEENNITVKWEHVHDGFHGMFPLGGGPISFEAGRHARKCFVEYARHMFKYV
ncbi:neutral cholesterol ester hydrolase 1-like [Saccoglossus kowalevskii]|uniref:Neutral cholesterol ester hydrolase 1-like n=1 Tax=Saccoglossus kowalevskii TaxID=10224 RepID=A0ABM0GIH4_SACKO|nr:PREDICTED: neutral cholesterol ester hydrolase 1-like [Saccoglossus kowalevskii]